MSEDDEDLGAMLQEIEEMLGKLAHAGVAFDMDMAITEGPDGQPLLHIASCPDCRAAAAQGEFVVTLFGCQDPLPIDIARHSCTQEVAQK